MSISVQTSHDTCEAFSNKRIVDYLIEKVGLKESEARKIARSVRRKIFNKFDDLITSSEIREEVNSQLRNRGFVNEAREHERVGVPVTELRDLIRSHNCDNANLTRNPETVHKFAADRVFKEYALMCLPKELATAHNRGNLHQHDLEYFPARPLNCLQHDLRWFIKEGLKVDGTGDHTSVAGPPNQLATLVNHIGEIMLAGQQNCSGGQSASLWNVFAAPFVEGMKYENLLQCVQMLVFNLNMAYSNRGGQVPFTSLNTEFTVPNFLKEEIAYGPGGKTVGTYEDYEEETRLLNRAFTEIMLQGDAIGKPHLFPNSIWVLRDEMMNKEFEEDLLKVHELSSKFSIPYFLNNLPSFTGPNSNAMGCRTRLNTNWTGDWEEDTLRTGNLAYVTLNLPRIAYKTNNDSKSFYDELDRMLALAEEILLIRREHSLKCLGKHKLLPFLTQKNKDGEQYYKIQNATISFGFVGMDEMLKAMNISDGLLDKEGQKVAGEVLDYMNNYAKNLVDETGYRWTVLQTPAESTAHRFATLDKQHYPDKAIVNGEEGSYYYTNSSHIPVDNDCLLTNKLRIESQYHSKTSGGHISHAYLTEETPEPEALMSLTKKMAKTDLGFFAYTSAFSYCFGCNHLLKGLQEQCGFCGSIDDVEQYSRVTGYLQEVGHRKNSAGGWNEGKKQELKDRYNYKV